jgi:hypothetical protein
MALERGIWKRKERMQTKEEANDSALSQNRGQQLEGFWKEIFVWISPDRRKSKWAGITVWRCCIEENAL